MKNYLILAVAICLTANAAFAGYDTSTESFPDGNYPLRPYTATLEDTATDIVSTDYIEIHNTLTYDTMLLDATKIVGLGTQGDDLKGRAIISICGDATTVNNNTIYYGPSQVVAAGGARTCNIAQAGSATETTSDTPAFPAAFQVLSWYCIQPDAGADLTYTLRNNAAAMVPAQAITIADNALHGSYNTGTTTEIAANNPISIAVSSASDVGTAQFACHITVAY